MKQIFNIVLLVVCMQTVKSQEAFGIVRQNYYSTYFDSIISTDIQVLDSSSISLGVLDATNGNIASVSANKYQMGINLTGATIDPYSNKYLISSGNNLLSFSLLDGSLINSVPITGSPVNANFQNYRFNASDSTIYGLVPVNFYSTYFDTFLMQDIEVLDSFHIRFAKIDPLSGQFTLIGNTPYKTVFTLAGNSIDPHQMVYYFSQVDTLTGIDIYTGAVYSNAKIQLPANTLFENFTYSCTDTAIYGLARENFFSLVYDSIAELYLQRFDSATIKLAKIDPSNGAVTIISPNNLGFFATLNGSCFIDPNTMTYFFSTGTSLVGISLASGSITSTSPFNYNANGMFIDMMRSSDNCFGAQKARQNLASNITNREALSQNPLKLFPNPAQNILYIENSNEFVAFEVLDITGRLLIQSVEKSINVSSLPVGLYFVKAKDANALINTAIFQKQ